MIPDPKTSQAVDETVKIVTTHKNTDFDALASVIAATILHPKSVPVLPTQLNANVKEFLAIHKDLLNIRTWKEVDHKDTDTLIIVDAGSWDRLSVPRQLQNKTGLDILLYDHHPHEGDIQAKQKYWDPVGANITIMMEWLKKKKAPFSPIQSTLFLAGLYEDTGNLSFPSTTPKDALTAAFLLENGADLNLLSNMLRPAYRQKQKNILFEMLKIGKRTRLNGFRIGFSKIPIDGFVDNLAVVVQMYREILNVDAAFGIFADTARNNCVVIGRSDSDQINMGIIMRSMGGGGVPGAGSVLVKEKTMDEIEERIIELLSGNRPTEIQVSDLMSFPVMTIRQDAPMREAAKILRKQGCTGVPVIDENSRIAGIISRRDFNRKIKQETQLKAPIKAFMSTDVITIQPGKSPSDASRLMIKHDIGRLPVIKDGKLIGIITRSDVMRYLYDLVPD
jgi:nanoRNase/pAp phosphatase (c-di-AMP/oligoRNAs hydrolase)